ncbi:hypothetical protein [Streptomyces sp. NPDC055400]
MTFTDTGSVMGVQGESRGPVSVSRDSSLPPTGAPLPLDRLFRAAREELRCARDREEHDPGPMPDAQDLIERGHEAAMRAEAAGPEEADLAGARAKIVRSLRQLRWLADDATGVLAAVGAALAAALCLFPGPCVEGPAARRSAFTATSGGWRVSTTSTMGRTTD